MIPYLDLKAQYRALKPEIDAAVAGVLESCQFILGPEVAAFEQEFAAFSNASFGVGMNSGTSALHLALLAAGIGPGDEVITTPYTFVATVAAIRYAGATPVLCDITLPSFNIDPVAVERAVTARTKAILPVHLYGQCADMDPLLDIARRHNLIVIEDAAQAHGAEYKGRRAGCLGQMACFSFYPGKNLGAAGEGGIVVTSDPAYNRILRMLRDWGSEQRYVHQLRGYNYRMEAIQGAILRVKLRHLDAWTEARRRNAARYAEALAGAADVIVPVELPGNRHVWHCYTVRVKDREAVRARLTAREIQHAIHYPTPIHLSPAHSDLGYGPGSFPIAEQVCHEVLSLPLFPEMTAAQVEEVAAVVRDTLN